MTHLDLYFASICRVIVAYFLQGQMGGFTDLDFTRWNDIKYTPTFSPFYVFALVSFDRQCAAGLNTIQDVHGDLSRDSFFFLFYAWMQRPCRYQGNYSAVLAHINTTSVIRPHWHWDHHVLVATWFCTIINLIINIYHIKKVSGFLRFHCLCNSRDSEIRKHT